MSEFPEHLEGNSGRIMGVHQQISLATIVAPDFKLTPTTFMKILGRAGVKIVPDDSEIMPDAWRVFQMEEEKSREKLNENKLRVVKNADSAEN